MALQTINLGSVPLGTGGDTARAAFTKVNANFSEHETRLNNLDTKTDTTNTNLITVADQVDLVEATAN